MNIIRAEHMGMCFGVRDAIALAMKEAKVAPITILGDLVHNETVLASLRAHGIQFEQQIDAVGTETVMITAHGASEKAVEEIKARGLKVLEATCPLVRFAHESVLKLANDGFHPVIIGKREHVEVRGLTGDLQEFDVVLTEVDVENLRERARFGIAAQTTQPIEKVKRLIGLIREKFPNAEIRSVDTVCRPTKQRQNAAIELAQKCDVVVVVGGANSNNTRELVNTCGIYCSRVHHVQFAGDLCSEWISGAETVGITAGTSTPDITINEVEQRLREMAGGRRDLN